MKVYFVYEGKDTDGCVVDGSPGEVYRVKIDLPAMWLTGPCEQLSQFVVTAYNKKHPKRPLVFEELSLWNGNVELKPSDIVETRVHEYNELHIRHKTKSAQQLQQPGSLPCTNYGCGKYFLPEENSDTACKHHAQPPIFHDIEKYWRCCPTRRVRDWDDFSAIPPCCTGPHSTEDRQVAFTSAPIVNVPLSQAQLKMTEAAAAAAATTVQDAVAPRRTTGPREFEYAIAAQGQPPQEIIDGKAKCRNYGCQQEFVVSENNPTACRFHSGGPVFWDTYKYWKCCPDRKCYEFDDFVKVPGCSVGEHKL